MAFFKNHRFFFLFLTAITLVSSWPSVFCSATDDAPIRVSPVVTEFDPGSVREEVFRCISNMDPDALRAGFTFGYDVGQKRGHDEGTLTGLRIGQENGKIEGYDRGKNIGFRLGLQENGQAFSAERIAVKGVETEFVHLIANAILNVVHKGWDYTGAPVLECLFPSESVSIETFNEGMKLLSAIRIQELSAQNGGGAITLEKGVVIPAYDEETYNNYRNLYFQKMDAIRKINTEMATEFLSHIASAQTAGDDVRALWLKNKLNSLIKTNQPKSLTALQKSFDSTPPEEEKDSESLSENLKLHASKSEGGQSSLSQVTA